MHSMQFNIRISSNCINCIRCVAVCPFHVLVRNSANRMVEVGSLGRCIGCGQCAAVCPTHALHHSAYPTEKIHPFKTEDCPTSEQFLLLCKKRRSNRTFSGQPVPKECLQKIMEAGSYAPTAHNAQDVCYKVITPHRSCKSLAVSWRTLTNTSFIYCKILYWNLSCAGFVRSIMTICHPCWML